MSTEYHNEPVYQGSRHLKKQKKKIRRSFSQGDFFRCPKTRESGWFIRSFNTEGSVNGYLMKKEQAVSETILLTACSFRNII